MQTGARQHPGLGRRAIVLHSVQWLPLGALTAGTDDVKTIVNSILGRSSHQEGLLFCASRPPLPAIIGIPVKADSPNGPLQQCN